MSKSVAQIEVGVTYYSVTLKTIVLNECYYWQNYTTVSKTDLYLSYFNLSYVFPGHNDSVKRGLTVPQNTIPIKNDG